MDDRTCEVPGCDKPLRNRGCCGSHYYRLLRYGDPLAGGRTKRMCSIEDCEKPADGRGWCKKHYTRWLRHGDPLATLIPAKQPCTFEGCTAMAKSRGSCGQHHPRVRRPVDTSDPRTRYEDLPGETWKPIPDFPGYEASDLGRVRSLPRLSSRGRRIHGTILRPSADPKGRQRVCLWREGRNRGWFVHQLVMRAFVGEPGPGQITRHGPNGITDNSLANLCYGTPLENQADRLRDGTDLRGSQMGRAVLTEDIVRKARALYAAGGITQRELADRYGVNRRTMGKALTGEKWQHVA